MTDKEKLSELLIYAKDLCSIDRQAEFLLANGVTFATDTNAGSKWISVEDDKPKKNGYYFCYHMTSEISGKKKWEIQKLYWEDGIWLLRFNSFKTVMNVTHWMPLPEPPID